jgi:hypothetical protein
VQSEPPNVRISLEDLLKRENEQTNHDAPPSISPLEYGLMEFPHACYPQCLTLHFETPLQIVRDKEIVSFPHFADIVEFLLDRTRKLALYYVIADMPFESVVLINAARRVKIIDAQLQYRDTSCAEGVIGQ